MSSRLEHREDPSGEGARFEDIVAGYIDRLIAGETLDFDDILAAHPESGDEIVRHLKNYVAIGSSEGSNESLGTLGDYTLRRQIGRGGMGVVYDAWQNSLDRQVALKVLPAGIAADNKAFMRFMREAKTAAQLQHQNVVAVYGMGVEQNTPYYAMEFVGGETLAQVIGKMRTAAPDAPTPIGASREELAFYSNVSKAFADVADGLQHAHSKGITHRDIKPSNLILDGEGRLRILDFGLARLEGQESLTASGDFLGTPLYMSPEQARRKKIPVDHRTDIYSLGATLYEMLVLRPPFQGKDHQDTLSQIIERDPVEPRKLNPRVPRDLETIVLKCLRKEPEDRYGTAEALGQDLRRFVRGDAIEARPQARWERLARRAIRNRWRIAAAAVVTVALGVLVFQAWSAWLAANAEAERTYSDRVLRAVARLELAAFSDKARAGELGWSTIFSVPPTTRPPGLDPLTLALDDLDLAVAAFPKRPDALYHRARALLHRGQQEAAMEILERLRSRRSPFVPALTLLESLRRQRQEPDLADHVHGEAGAATVDAWSGAWMEVHRGWLEGDLALIQAAYDRILAACQDGVEPFLGCRFAARMGRGRASLSSGNFAEAVRDFHAAQLLVPGSVHPVVLEAQAWWLVGQKDAAESILAEAFPRASNADEMALLVADMFHRLQEAGKTIDWLGRIHDPVVREAAQCEKLQEIGRWEEAIAAGKKAVELDPRSIYAHATLGWAYRLQGRLREAREVMVEGLQLDPASYDLNHFLGSVSWMEGKYEEAIHWYGEAARFNRGFGRPELYKLAGAYILAGRTADGMEKAREARQAALQDSGGENMLGWAFLQTGRFEEALDSFKRINAYDPAFSFPWINKALTLLALGDEEAALRALRDGQGKYPFAMELYSHPFFILGRQGKHEEAISEILKAFEQVPDHAEAHRIAGGGLRALLGTLDPEKARPVRSTIEKALERAPASLLAKSSLALALLLPPSPDAKDLEYAAKLAVEAWSDELDGLGRQSLTSNLRAVSGRFEALDGSLVSCHGWLPSLPPYGAIDAVVAGAGDLSACSGPSAALRALAADEDHARRLLYLEATFDEAAGRRDEAAAKLRRLRTDDPSSWEPLLRLARILVEEGSTGLAEGELQAALTAKAIAPPEVWDTWLEVSFVRLGRTPAEVLAVLPPPVSKESEARADYGADVRWLLETLAGGDSLRINCGGDDVRDAAGRLWGRDRFFRGGIAAFKGHVEGIGEAMLHRSERTFPLWDPGGGSGYALPLPPGRYEVGLQFAETAAAASGVRRFDVRIQGDEVLTDFDILGEADAKTVLVKRFEAAVKGGRLEIRFEHRKGLDPKVDAIEVRRLK